MGPGNCGVDAALQLRPSPDHAAPHASQLRWYRISRPDASPLHRSARLRWERYALPGAHITNMAQPNPELRRQVIAIYKGTYPPYRLYRSAMQEHNFGHETRRRPSPATS